MKPKNMTPVIGRDGALPKLSTVTGIPVTGNSGNFRERFVGLLQTALSAPTDEPPQANG